MTQKLDTHGPEPMTEEQLEQALELLDQMKRTDIENLRSRVDKSIDRMVARRRRLRMWRNCAAVAVPLICMAGALLVLGRRDNGDVTDSITRVVEDVRLVLPDGSRIIIDNTTDNTRVADMGDAVILRGDGGLVCEPVKDGAVDAAPVYGKLEVPRGAQFDIVLADGTHVWLNAGSNLRFPSAFNGEHRRVYLEGEAYFEVTPDSNKPFVVESGGQSLTVLGTEFNVTAYEGDDGVYTTLVSGSVRLAAGSGGEPTLLAPGQQSVLKHGSDRFEIREVDAVETTAWREGLFVIDGDPLAKVFAKLARWYNFEYTFEDEAAAQLVLRGNLPMYDDISSILQLIAISGQVDVEQSGNKVIVRMKR